MTLQLKKRNIFRLKLEKGSTKNRINRDIRNLLEHEEDYHKPVRVSNSWSNFTLNMKVPMIEIKQYQLKIS